MSVGVNEHINTPHPPFLSLVLVLGAGRHTVSLTSLPLPKKILNIKSQYISRKETREGGKKFHLVASGRWYLSLFDLLLLTKYFDCVPCLFSMICFPHSFFFDSFSWELNSCEKCRWARRLHQKFTYINSKVEHQNILVSYSKGKNSEHCWQTQESRTGHGDWGYHRLLQATGQTVTDAINDTWW